MENSSSSFRLEIDVRFDAGVEELILAFRDEEGLHEVAAVDPPARAVIEKS
ncbi:MAG: hypothetical protein ABEJ81_04475 [Haloferacaceae archaeon]